MLGLLEGRTQVAVELDHPSFNEIAITFENSIAHFSGFHALFLFTEQVAEEFAGGGENRPVTTIPVNELAEFVVRDRLMLLLMLKDGAIIRLGFGRV
jgi:hypothetical protein